MNIGHTLRLQMAAFAVTSTLATHSTVGVAQTAPPDFPAALLCYAKADQSWRVGYLYKIKENGDASYLAADGKLGATVNAKGVVEAPDNRPAGLDCYGKTLDELRSSGRTLEFQRK